MDRTWWSIWWYLMNLGRFIIFVLIARASGVKGGWLKRRHKGNGTSCTDYRRSIRHAWKLKTMHSPKSDMGPLEFVSFPRNGINLRIFYNGILRILPLVTNARLCTGSLHLLVFAMPATNEASITLMNMLIGSLAEHVTCTRNWVRKHFRFQDMMYEYVWPIPQSH